jgi:Restriction endonuclease S subunits
MAENRKIPAIRFKGFNEAWEQREFVEMVTRNSTMAVCNSGLPSVEYEDIVSGQGVLNKDIRQKETVKMGIRFSPYDVLFGKLRPYLQNWLLPDFPGVAVGDFWVMKPSEIDSQYLYYLIQTTSFQVAANQSTGTKMPRADWSLVSKTPFNLPKNQAEQARIGQTLQAIDNLITLHQRKLLKIKNIKKAMLEKMFPQNGQNTPEIRFNGFTDAWEQRKVKIIFKTIADKGYPELTVLSASQEFGMINRTDTGINIHHDIRNEIGYKRVLPGQFVIHLRSFQGGFAHSAVEGITSPAYTVLDFQEQEKHYDYFWKYIFNSEEFIRRLELITYGIRDGRSISFEDFTTLDFYFPSCEEQKRIGKYFQEIDNLITLHQRKLDKLNNIKKACLEKMFI